MFPGIAWSPSSRIALFYLHLSVCSSTSGMAKGGNPTYPHEIKTKSGLTALYNQPVLKREHVQRDMSSSGGKPIPFVPHQGVKITTPSGEYLVHKGPNYGKQSDAVLVPASSMSSAWKPSSGQAVKHGGGMTVGDAMKAANQHGSSYSVLTGNCIHAAKDVMKK